MSSVSSLTAIFSNIYLQLSRYVYCPLYICGNLGNLLNLIVFSQSKVRNSSVCSWYFLCISVVSLIAMNTGYLTRILGYMGLPDPSRTIGWYCTIRVYISTVSLTLNRHFVCSVVLDRFLVTSTNVKLRQLSSFKVAKWYIPLSIICWMIFYCHLIVGYPTSPNGLGCKRQDGVYTLFVTISSVIIESITPIVLMIIFSLLTINNLHGLNQRRNRIVPLIHGNEIFLGGTTTNHNITGGLIGQVSSDRQSQRVKQKVNKQLTMISLIQVIVYIMLNTLSSSYAVYSILTTSIVRSPNRLAIESFINAIAVMLTFIYGTLNFYIYTMVSSTYRGEVTMLFKQSLIIIQRRLTILSN